MKVLLTGSSGCLGSYLASSLLQDGADVRGVDLAPPTNQFVSSLTPQEASRWRYSAVDLTSSESIAALASEISLPDVIINNAGWLFSAPLVRFESGKLLSHDSGDWNKAIATNLDAAFIVLAQFSRLMIAAGKKGVIVNISSVSSQGNVGQAAYSAAKAGLNALTVVAAKELGPLGIRVAAIAPGFLDTESMRSAVTEDALSRLRKAIPLGRFGKPAHLYHAIKFVMENDYFHGKLLELDGGLSL